MKRKFLILLVGILFISLNSYLSYTRLPQEKIHTLIESDGFGYYIYLPAFFIHNDVLHQGYAMQLDNGYMLNKYTCGVALLETPFFLIADCLNDALGADQHNGRGWVYMLLMAISTATYMCLALTILFFFIKKKFDGKVALISVLVIYLATNAFYYTVIEPGLSHIYSLFCFSVCLYFTDRYYKTTNIANIIGFGVFWALATLIRPTNGLLILFFLFYEVYSFNELKLRLKEHLYNYRHFIVVALVSLIIASPQFLYWYKITGKPIIFSYGYNHESFSNWKSPKIIEVLVGHKSGWLLHTPVMIFSLIGMVMAYRAKKLSAPVMISLFLLTLLVCASWWAYTFGCAFGYRSFIEYYALLILPLGFFVDYVFKKRKVWVISFLALLLLFVYMNLQMTYLYAAAPCWDGPDWHWENYLWVLKEIF